ncbi:unnamed protein product [marine sediment metagenome]|uniref:Uncharacterized protein n=1 Tax=marine sediment metagenome TaxID=412755 RepID=X1IG63_9ZZZZ
MVEKRAFATLLEECAMSTEVAELTVDELKYIIQEAMEQKLSEMLGNPDEGLELRPQIEQRLSSSLDYVTAGGKTLSLEEITARVQAE